MFLFCSIWLNGYGASIRSALHGRAVDDTDSHVEELIALTVITVSRGLRMRKQSSDGLDAS